MNYKVNLIQTKINSTKITKSLCLRLHVHPFYSESGLRRGVKLVQLPAKLSCYRDDHCEYFDLVKFKELRVFLYSPERVVVVILWLHTKSSCSPFW